MLACHPGGFQSGEVARYLEKFYRLVLEEPPHALPSGHDTAVWRLATRAGDYVAKIFAAERLAAVRAELQLLDYLADCGIGTPQVLKNRRGQRPGLIGARRLLPAFVRGACPIVVTRVEAGRRLYPETIAPGELRLIAQCVGLLHAALQAYPGHASVRRLERWGPHLGGFEHLLGSANGQSFDSEELARWKDLDRRMEQAVAAMPCLPLTASVLHGDLGLEHIRLLHDDARSPAHVYFFDFSDFCYGPVVFDLAVMLSRFYWEGDIDFARWRELRDGLLEGYEAVLRLGENDHRVIDAALLERLLIEIRYLNRTSRKLQAPYCPEGVKKRYALVSYLLEREAGWFPASGRIAS